MKSKLAVEINVSIIRTFVSLRKIQSEFYELFVWKDKVENILSEHANQILFAFELLEEIERLKSLESEHNKRPRIGFKPTTE